MDELSKPIEPVLRRKILVTGALVGCVTGLVAAFLLLQRAERQQTSPRLTTGEGVKVGALIFTLLRQIALLGG